MSAYASDKTTKNANCRFSNQNGNVITRGTIIQKIIAKKQHVLILKHRSITLRPFDYFLHNRTKLPFFVGVVLSGIDNFEYLLHEMISRGTLTAAIQIYFLFSDNIQHVS